MTVAAVDIAAAAGPGGAGLPPLPRATKIVLVLLLTSLSSGVALLAKAVAAASARGGGRADGGGAAGAWRHYNPVAVTLASEVIKLLISAALICASPDEVAAVRHSLSAVTAAKLSVVAVLYVVVNNLMYPALLYMDSGTLTVLFSFRIPLAAFLLYLIGNRRFSARQKSAIFLLFAGAVLVQADAGALLGGRAGVRASFAGAAHVAGMVLASSFGSVFNELMLKDSALGSLNLQNLQVCAFGIAANGAVLALMRGGGDPRQELSVRETLRRFGPAGWGLAVTLALSGIVTSVLLKYTDNIVRALAIVSSIIVTVLVSHVWLAAPLTSGFAVGTALACAALFLYLT